MFIFHFWATVCKGVRSMVSDRCLSVSDVGILSQSCFSALNSKTVGYSTKFGDKLLVEKLNRAVEEIFDFTQKIWQILTVSTILSFLYFVQTLYYVIFSFATSCDN